MIRSELIARIAEQNPYLYAKDAEAVVEAILGCITAALVDGDRVELRDFGTFAVRQHEARASPNPRAGAAVAVSVKTRIHFKPGKAMRARLNPGKIDPERHAKRTLRVS